MATVKRHIFYGKSGERLTVDPGAARRVDLTSRPPAGAYGLEVFINSPAPGGSMQATNPQASGTSTGASSITVTLEPAGSTTPVPGGYTGLGNWTAQFRPSPTGSYVLTAEVTDGTDKVSESISVTLV